MQSQVRNVPVLRNKTFLILWGGQLVSVLGDMLFSLALMWWVVSETGSGVAMSGVALGSSLPRLLLGPIVGVYVDRLDRRKMMLTADTLNGIITAGMAVLYWRGHFSLPVIIGSATLMGAVTTLDAPAYEASIPTIVGEEQLVRANSLMQTANSVMGLVVPALSGVLVAVAGVGASIIVNSITFFFAAFTLLLIRIPSPRGGAVQSTFRSDLSEGVRFIVRNRLLMPMLIFAALINLTLAPVSISLPLLVVEVLSGGPALLGLFGSFQSAGVLGASLILSAFPQGLARTGRVMVGSLVALGVFTMLIALAPSTIVFLMGGTLVGFVLVVANVASQAIWQCEVPDGLRGRAFTARETISSSLRPIGQALTGPLLDRVGPVWLMGGAGLLCAVGGILGFTIGSIVEYPQPRSNSQAQASS